MNFSERLHLKAAGQGDETVGQQIGLLRQKGHQSQQQNLRQHPQLPPVNPVGAVAEPLANQKGHQNPQAKGQHGKGVLHRHPPLPLGQGHAAQQDISCLGVGKDLPSKEIGISVHQPSRQCQ